jgi:ERCC4-type nuclease
MKIIIDERERDLFAALTAITVEKALPKGTTLEKRTLPLGDMILSTNATNDGGGDKPTIIFERKTLADLAASIRDGRYAEQSFRLQNSAGVPAHRVIYVIEGFFQGHSFEGNSDKEKQTVYSAMVSLNQFKGFSVVRTLSVQETAVYLLNMANKLQKEFDKGAKGKVLYSHPPCFTCFSKKGGVNEENSKSESKSEAEENTIVVIDSPLLITLEDSALNMPPEKHYSEVVKCVKKENITAANIGAIMLSQIPGISPSTATTILAPFATFADFLTALRADASFLADVKIDWGGKKRKLSAPIAARLVEYFCETVKPETDK